MSDDPLDMAPGDELPPDNANAAPDLCPRCHGAGEVEGRRCEECGGSGEVIAAVGGG